MCQFLFLKVYRYKLTYLTFAEVNFRKTFFYKCNFFYLNQSPKVISGSYCECKNFGCPKVKPTDEEECGGKHITYNILLLRIIYNLYNLLHNII